MENTKFKVYIEEKTQDYGRIFLEPLERGYGDTLGNALRRLLLSSIRGAAVIAVRIDGILHEFSTIKGVREDVLEILMNLKRIPIRVREKETEAETETEKEENANTANSDEEVKVITLDSERLPEDFFTREENPGTITAKDISKAAWDLDYEFCGDGVLCTLEPGASLVMEIYVQQGTGYLSAERERPSKPSLPIDALLTDAIFSPVKRVNYQIEPARVGQSIDFERLLLEVWTDGSVTPEEAVEQAARIAEDYFRKIGETVLNAPVTERVIVEPPKVVAPVQAPEDKKKRKPKVKDSTDINDNIDDGTPEDEPGKREELEKILATPIREIKDFSIRSLNCLLRGNITTMGELVAKTHDELLNVRNLGKKSLDEIEEILDKYGLSFKEPPIESEEPEEEEEDLSFQNDDAADSILTDIHNETEDLIAERMKNNLGDVIDEPSVIEEPEQENEIPETVEEPVKKKTTSKAKTKESKEVKEAKEDKKTKKAKADKKSDKPEKTKTKSKAKSKSEEKVEEAVEAEEVDEAVEEEVKPKKVKGPKKTKETKTSSKTAKTEKAKKSDTKSKTKSEAKPKKTGKKKEEEV